MNISVNPNDYELFGKEQHTEKGRAYMAIRNCLLGSIQGGRTPERVKEKLVLLIKKHPYIKQYLIQTKPK